MKYVIKLENIKEFYLENVSGLELKDNSYFLYAEDGTVLLTAPHEKTVYIAKSK